MSNALKTIDHWFAKVDLKLKDWQFLTGNSLKVIACISMLIDHFTKIVLFGGVNSLLVDQMEAGLISEEAYFQFSDFVRLKLVTAGRVAYPLFCFVLVEGFRYTHDRKKYGRNLLLFAFLSEIPFDLAFFSDQSQQMGTFPFYWPYQNVMWTLFLGLLTMACLEKLATSSPLRKEKIKAFLLQILSVLVFCLIAEGIHCDYASEGILIITALYIGRNNRIYQFLLFLLAYMVTNGEQPSLFILVAALCMLAYNGKRGNAHLKYGFYAFYPLHLFILYLVDLALLCI